MSIKPFFRKCMGSFHVDNFDPLYLQHNGASAHDAVELIEDKLAAERMLRKTCEAQCHTLRRQLESRDDQLEQVKHSLMSRVADAETQMDMLVRLHGEEKGKAEKAANKLRASVQKLQRRHDFEKEELQNALIGLQEANEKQAEQWKTLLRQSEADRDVLSTELRKSEANANKLAEENTRFKKELEQANSLTAQLQKSNNQLTVDLTKAKCAFQKASSRAETAATQIGDLRKQLEQATLASSQSEQSARSANERRLAAESALHAVRQRADTQSLKIGQLERELATEKARMEEKSNSFDAESQKLRRRILAIQGEAAKWKRFYEAERDVHKKQIDQATELVEELTHERAQLEVELTEACAGEAKKLELIEQLQKQATMNATDVSCRLRDALSTGEESVATVRELNRLIAEYLQPELEKAKRRCQEAQEQSQEWRRKHGLIQNELAECRETVKHLESRLSGKQISTEHELDSLKEQLARAKEEKHLQSASLKKAEDQVRQYEVELAHLKQTHENVRASLEDSLSNVKNQLVEVKSSHETNTERLNTAQRLVVRLKTARDSALAQLTRMEDEFKLARKQHERSQSQTMDELAALKLQLQVTQQKLSDTERMHKQVAEDHDKQLQNVRQQHDRTTMVLRQKLAAKSQTVASLELQVAAQREELVTAQNKVKTACDSQLVSERRLEESERKLRSLELDIIERDDKIQRLLARVSEENANVPEKEQRNPQNHQTAVSDNMEAHIEPYTQHSAEAGLAKKAVNDRLRELEQAVIAAENERNNANARMRELEFQLLQRKHIQSERETEQMQDQRKLLEELRMQLQNTQSQRDHVEECLRETKDLLNEQTTAKRTLEERLQNMHQQYEQAQVELKSELSASQRERFELKRQLAETRFKLQRAEALAQDTEYRVSQVELEQKRALRDSEQLAVDSAARKVISEFTTSSFLQSPSNNDGMEVSGNPENSSHLTQTNFVDNPTCKQTGHDVQTLRPINPINCEKQTRKVTFAPSPLVDSNEVTRSTSTAASQLEALIREVTDSLDREIGPT
ncbi:hypothetical protein CSKR_102708 [Clonorchis sinensis]|uniref:Spindle assembly checkpoint component MAD1 n=2 Tax=Clonorchis sinensis TaxID=79923 RepID=H2KQ34_CLOSI|nr:hypothetical protein CSKR_102708 [Clonorchis sinensis]GAA31266.2 spindle assembly checkpoint component MAD1 [Clonorchis sinensis]